MAGNDRRAFGELDSSEAAAGEAREELAWV